MYIGVYARCEYRYAQGIPIDLLSVWIASTLPRNGTYQLACTKKHGAGEYAYSYWGS
jgi:hypothetical protein